MDSLSLAQFSGALTHKFGFRVRDELLFSDSVTLSWLVDNAAMLRRGEEPAAIAATVCTAPRAGAHDQSISVDPAAAVTAGAGAAAPADPSRAVQEVDPAFMRGRPGRRRPGWFEQNCPCCMWCW